MTLGSIFSLKLAPLVLAAAAFAGPCSGSVEIADQSSGCIEVTGGTIKYSVSSGVLTVTGNAAALTVSMSDDPQCEECWITGKMSIFVDANGNGVQDPGEPSFDNTVDSSQGGPSTASITLGGTQVNGVDNATVFVISYSFVDCFGNKVERSYKLSG